MFDHHSVAGIPLCTASLELSMCPVIDGSDWWQMLFIRLNNLSTEAVLEGISNYDRVSNRCKTVRWLPDKSTRNSNDSID
ncbi:hypothetical protein DPMN_061129 [Dreissena polymorpha]|uniref:Uncharacterized protein n=1 Tax=Dreissena polymorpha TaxID=45954 RepID=A0A9D4HIW5_DREPO|nr:hypothetical protein DPMN_061129 [Dreissena polymorpha]